jgi:catechol 1,2-dioxygenase
LPELLCCMSLIVWFPVLPHPGYRTLITQVFVDDDEHLTGDVTFSVVRSLVGKFVEETGKPPADDIEGEWYMLHYDLYLQPGELRIPEAPIP